MLNTIKSLGDFLGVILNKLLFGLPKASFTVADVTHGIDKFNDSHFMNYLNWFIPVDAMLGLFSIFFASLIVGIGLLILVKFIMKKFGN